MQVTLTLTGPAGMTILSRTFIIHDQRRLAGDIGQAAWQLYGEASRLGFSPIDTTLTVKDGEETGSDLAERAAALVATSRRARATRR